MADQSYISSGFDVQSIASLRGLASGTKNQKDEAIETIAKEFESLFFNLIAKSMNEATKTMNSGLLDNKNIELFQEMLWEVPLPPMANGSSTVLQRSLLTPSSAKLILIAMATALTTVVKSIVAWSLIATAT